MEDISSEFPLSKELKDLFDCFAIDHDLRFEGQAPNLFDFISQNPVKAGDENILIEEDITGYIAERIELPICSNNTLQPTKTLMDRCAAVGFPVVGSGFVPILEIGPGIVLAHYDPFQALPPCFHKQNIQIVLCTLSNYKKLREGFNERYTNAPGTDVAVVPVENLPTYAAEWAEWQLKYNPLDETGQRILDRIKSSDSFEDTPPEWEYWFLNKEKSQPCFSLSLLERHLESKRVNSAALKSVESVILYENRRLVQIGHVVHWDRYNSLEAVLSMLRRLNVVVQTITLTKNDYSRYQEDLLGKQANLGQFIKKDAVFEESLVDEIDPSEFSDTTELTQDDQRIRKMAELIIFNAFKRGASDILIEPQTNDYRVRFTIDGINHIFHSGIPKGYGGPIVAHLKVRASMSITERRMPQDGKITLQLKVQDTMRPIELRAATMPVRDNSMVQEEKMTMRLLSTSVTFPNLDRIGLVPDHLALLRKALTMSNGIIIITGPTGSGKTTTLYAAIQELDRERLNVVSLEDPVESFITGITQTQINEAIGLNFAVGLRAILRQAPHVILLGEIRDKEVAHIAVQAANTGHLVLTTLHTNSALGTFARLQALGAETHQIADAVRLIAAQRLIPKLCQVCRKSRKPSDVEIVRIQKACDIKLANTIYYNNAAGCRNCHKGYVGRRILTEVIPVDGIIRDILLHHTSENMPLKEIAEHATKVFKYSPLLNQAIRLVNEGQCDLKDAQKLFLDFGE